MGTIIKGPNKALDAFGTMNVPAMQIPSFRSYLAIERKNQNKMLLYTRGGVGDYLCAEPAFRYAFKTIKGVEFSLATTQPELFRHLPFAKVYDLRETKQPAWSDYFVIKSFYDADELLNEFMCHMILNPVNYIALAMWRVELPAEDRAIRLEPTAEEREAALVHIQPNDVVIHAGRSWQTKTFPVSYWNEILQHLIVRGYRPVLIGGSASVLFERGTVNVERKGCLDLRNRLPLMSSVALLQNSKVLITNDSLPLHAAASGANCWIGYYATTKRPDLLRHYRPGSTVLGHRMHNLALGGLWEGMNISPTNPSVIAVDIVSQSVLEKWLPTPESVASWAIEKLEE